MSRLRRQNRLCSSTVSDTANRLLKRTDSEGSSAVAEKKSSVVPLFRSGRRSLICARLRNKGKVGVQRGRETAVFQKQFPFNYTKSSKVEQKYSISPLKCLQSVILKSEVSIMQCKGSTKSTVSGRFKIIVAEISGVICGVKIQVAAAANMK